MKPTEFVEINHLLDELLADIQATLGPKLVGLYLYGSLATGDFDQAISDIDLVAVLDADLSGQDAARLLAMHTAFGQRHPVWEDRVEVAYLSKTALQTFRECASTIGIISPGEPFHTKAASKDWLVNWYIVREHGKTLYGPPPAAVIGPIAKEEFLQIIDEHARAWAGWVQDISKRRGSQAYAIITLCRALYTHTFGEQPSKKQAAGWAMQHLPEWAPLIQRALAWREQSQSDQSEDTAAFPETVAFVNFVIQRISDSTYSHHQSQYNQP